VDAARLFPAATRPFTRAAEGEGADAAPTLDDRPLDGPPGVRGSASEERRDPDPRGGACM
jgi:hypothetical protein